MRLAALPGGREPLVAEVQAVERAGPGLYRIVTRPAEDGDTALRAARMLHALRPDIIVLAVRTPHVRLNALETA